MLAVDAGLTAHGWKRDDCKAVERVIAELQNNDPSYKTLRTETLERYYYRMAPLPLPAAIEEAIEEDRWMSLLMKWVKATKRHPPIISADEAREIISRLRAVVPPHRHNDLDRLFDHMDHNRIHWSGRLKINWLRDTIDRLAANPNDWPIPLRRRGKPNETAARIETYLANTPKNRAHKRDIVAALKIPKTTAQTTLCSLERADRIRRVENGMYSLPMDGVAPYIPTDKAILDALAGGQRTCPELKAETGKSEGAVSAALHRLHNAGSIVLTKPGKYALAGSASPHVYARDAITDALRSGKKTMPELIAATGKNYGEIWQALRRMGDKREVIRVARRGQIVAFALPGAGRAPRHRTLRAA
jgi:DNA-binding IclR family transcriptional regulator